MKKYILFYCTLAYSVFYAQTTNLPVNENYSYTKTCLTEDCTKKIESVQYLDGLARPKQAISIKGSPTGKDVVQHIEYDALGRITKEYLPVPQQGTQNGLSYSNPLDNASSIYGSEKIYSEIVIENSPLSRIQKKYNVGTDWVNKPINFDYSVNENEVIRFVTSTTWENGATKSVASVNGSYPAHKLYKNKVTDEDGNETIEYKNDQGQIILSKKIISTSESTDTYYVYNEYNQLVYVLSPLASKQIAQQTSGVVADNVLNKLSYQYKYDTKGRIVEKKIPGKETEYFVYDQQDRMIMSQDTKQRNNNEWSFVKYDKFGRVLYTGITQNPDSRQNIQAFINDSQNQFNFDSRTASAFNMNNMDVYYTNTAFPTSIKKLLTINYYDTYPIGNPGRPIQVLNQNTLPDEAQTDGLSTLGLPTASYINNIESDGWTRNYNWYDLKGRVVSTYSYNYLGGYTKLESLLDFAGVAQKINTSHRRQASTPVVNIKERFVYSDQNVLFQRYHQVDDNPEELLAEYHYDEKGRMDNKKVGNSLQSIDFSYNIRGWMTGINKDVINNLPASGKLFSYDIRHQNPESSSSLELYNGTVSEVSWNVSNTNIKRRYNYRYDTVNRLTDAIFSNPNDAVPLNHFNDEKVTYDANGNILTLKRNAKNSLSLTPQLIDELQYNYDGNRLLSVNDNYNNTGYEGGGNTIGYDVNGNMTNMLDKNIQTIGYNFLNLANSYSITENGTQTIQYTYRADGTKMSKVYSANNNDSSSLFSTTDYLDGFQYQLNDGSTGSMSLMSRTAYEPQSFTESEWNPIPTAELQFFPTTEGFYDYKTKQYIYQYKDHLGNVRVTYKNNAGIPQIVDQNDYYAFGMNIAGDKKSIFNTGSYYNYKFGQKEIQENGFYDFGARMYMADLGRWNGIDPLAEQMRRHSPYNYAFNNPINFIDPDGMKALPPQEPVQNFMPAGGMFAYYAAGGRGDRASVLAFLGLNDQLSSAVFDVGFGGGGGGGLSPGTPFGQTQAYRDIMSAWENGRTASLINRNGYLSWWTNMSKTDVAGDIQGLEQHNIKLAGIMSSPFGNSYSNNNQIWPHMVGPALTALGSPIIPKRLLSKIGMRGFVLGEATPNTSVASIVFRKIIPKSWPRLSFLPTAGSLGGQLGKAVPIVGIGMMVWDLSYNVAPWLSNQVINVLPYSEEQKQEDQHHQSWVEGGMCFKAGTLVTGDKKNINIEDVIIGDKVLSYNVKLQKVELSKVKKISKRITNEIFELTIGEETIWVTREHPFYVKDKGWIKVGNLKKGENIITKNGFKKVIGYKIFLEPTTVYNIEVSKNHNYYITNSEILVHNKKIKSKLKKRNGKY